MSLQDQRRFVRVTVGLSVEIVVPGQGMIVGRLRDVGLGGLFVECEERLPLGTGCMLAVVLDGAEPPVRIEGVGQVIRAGGGGLAIQIAGVEESSLAHLLRLIELNAHDPDLVRDQLDAFVRRLSAAEEYGVDDEMVN